MEIKKQQEKMEISFEHTENKNTKNLIKGVRSLLEKGKEMGILDFKARRRRKCDYCNKTLTDKDKFTTTKDGDNILDKCEECMKMDKISEAPEYKDVEGWHLIDKIKVFGWLSDMMTKINPEAILEMHRDKIMKIEKLKLKIVKGG